jgi:hypothetical protein
MMDDGHGHGHGHLGMGMGMRLRLTTNDAGSAAWWCCQALERGPRAWKLTSIRIAYRLAACPCAAVRGFLAEL